MDNLTTNRSILRGGIGATLIILSLLLPLSARAGLSGDSDSYAYPLIGKFSRTDSGNGVSIQEKGERYGFGVFFRLPMSTRMEGSPNVEAATESDRRFIANFRAEFDFIKAELTGEVDNAANTTYTGIRPGSAIGEAKYRLFYGDGDVGYRLKMGAAEAIEPFLGLGLIYGSRDIDGSGFPGHTTYMKIISARTGIRGEYDLGGEMSLFGELGLRLPLYTQIKENLAASVTYSPAMGFSDSETIGFRYAQYRFFLFHERTEFKESTSDGGIARPASREETVGLRFGFGY